MSRKKLLQGVSEVFRDVFDDDTISVTDTTTANDIEDWDSLGQTTWLNLDNLEQRATK